MSPVDLVIDRLSAYRVRPSGPGRWRACCPAHDGSNPSTLSIGEGANGSALIRCWSGCSLESIVASLDLAIEDLFPAKDAYAGPPRRRRMLSAAQALDVLLTESLVVFVVASDVHTRREIAEADWSRLALAVERIQALGAEVYE